MLSLSLFFFLSLLCKLFCISWPTSLVSAGTLIAEFRSPAIFPEGPKADDWFGVANLFKKVLIDANRAWSSKQKRTPHTGNSKVSNNLSYADALRGRGGKPNSSILKY